MSKDEKKPKNEPIVGGVVAKINGIEIKPGVYTTIDFVGGSKIPKIIGKCVGVTDDGQFMIVDVASDGAGAARITLPMPEKQTNSVEWMRGLNTDEIAMIRRMAVEYRMPEEYLAEEYRKYNQTMQGFVGMSMTPRNMRAVEETSRQYQRALEMLSGAIMPEPYAKSLDVFLLPIDEPAKPEAKKGRFENLDVEDHGGGK